MPSGKTHLKVELFSLAGFAAIACGANAFFELVDWEDEFKALALVFSCAYLFSALLLSPDLDLARSDPHNRWGLLRICWIPYAKLFRHRGLSHNPLLGPLSRLVYLGLWASLVLAGLHYLFEVEIEFLRHWWEDLRGTPLWALGLGLVLPNEIHILLDKIYRDP
jgi:uncharacterized metal-binding protein